MQIAVDQRLGGGQEFQLEPRHRHMQVAILAELRRIGVELRRGPAVQFRYAIGVREDQILGDLAQGRVAREGGDHRLLGIGLQRQIGSVEQRCRHEGGNRVGELRINGAGDHAAPHDDVRLQKFHDDQRQLVVIVIDIRHQGSGVFGLGAERHVFVMRA